MSVAAVLPGSVFGLRIYLATVLSETSSPSFTSSPWIRWAVQVGFSLNNWDKEWKRLDGADEKSRNVYISGKIIDSILVEIRDELKKLYDKAPKVSNEKLLMIYFAFSNRDRAILKKSRGYSVLVKSYRTLFSENFHS